MPSCSAKLITLKYPMENGQPANMNNNYIIKKQIVRIVSSMMSCFLSFIFYYLYVGDWLYSVSVRFDESDR